MPDQESFPALMVLHEDGQVLFADSQAEAWAGLAPGETCHVADLLSRMYPVPRDRGRAARLVRRMAQRMGRGGSFRFQGGLRGPGSGLKAASVRVHRCSDLTGADAFLVSIQPEPAPGQELIYRAMARRVFRILDNAVAYSRHMVDGEGEADPRLGVLVAMVERAKGLLWSLEMDSRSVLP